MLDNNIYTLWAQFIYSPEFWIKAEKRSPIVSKPLQNIKLELVRLENFNNFNRKQRLKLWKNEDYYKYWEILEKNVTDVK
jgi:hypothetical protein